MTNGVPARFGKPADLLEDVRRCSILATISEVAWVRGAISSWRVLEMMMTSGSIIIERSGTPSIFTDGPVA